MHSSRKLKQVRHIWFSVVSSCLTGCALSDSSVFHEVLVFMWLWMRTNYCQQIWSLSLKPESHTVQAVRATCVLFAWGSLSVLPFSPPSRLQIHLFTVSSSFLYTRSNGTDKSPPPNKMNIVVCKWPYSYWIWNDIRNMLLSLDESLYLCDPELLIVHFPRLWETTNWRPDHCRLACSRWIVCPT